MKQATLSVCMIVRNEENNIGRCLESMKDLADEIIIVDTGSTDRTMDIIKQYKVKLVEKKWEDDFSKARNQSLELATKEWVLFIDADEAIPYEDGVKLKRILSHPQNHFEGYYFRLLTMIDGECIREAVVLRIFKNKKAYRFEGRIHEQIIQSIQAKKGMACIGNTDVRLLHYGHDQGEEVSKRKQKRNIDLLLKCSEEEKHCYYYYVLGNEYLRGEDIDEAINCFEKSCYMVDYKAYPYMHYPYLVVNLAKMYHTKEDYAKEIRFIQEVKQIIPDFRDLYFLETLAYIECQQFSKAKKSFYHYLSMPEKGSYEYPCNHFETSYDMQFAQNLVNTQSVPHQEDILTVKIVGDSGTNWIEAVKSFNEIASCVVVPAPIQDRVQLIGLGAVEEVEGCTTQYVLELYIPKVITLEEKRQLVELMEAGGASYDLLDQLPGHTTPVLFGKLKRNN